MFVLAARPWWAVCHSGLAFVLVMANYMYLFWVLLAYECCASTPVVLFGTHILTSLAALCLPHFQVLFFTTIIIPINSGSCTDRTACSKFLLITFSNPDKVDWETAHLVFSPARNQKHLQLNLRPSVQLVWLFIRSYLFPALRNEKGILKYYYLRRAQNFSMSVVSIIDVIKVMH